MVMVKSKQYRLTRNAVPGAVELGGWFLETGASLRVIRVIDDSGRATGVLVGEPFDLHRREIAGDRLNVRHRYEGDADAFVNRSMDDLSGAYLWFFDDGTGPLRSYPDPFAQIPVVFDPEIGVATSADSLLDDGAYEARFDAARYRHFGVGNKGWFPAGMTAHRGVERLLPNHVLDLGDFEVARFWPDGPLHPAADPDAAVGSLLEHVAMQIAAVAETRPTVISLTAGQDTRLLLASSRSIAEKADFVTVVGGDQHSIDSKLARRLAEFAGLRQRELPRIVATDDEVEAYIRRTGHCVADANARYHKSVHLIERGTWFIGGLGGEVGRGFLWRPSDDASLAIEARRLIARFGLPQDADLEARLAAWIAAAPKMSGLDLLDLAYIEHRMGPWASAHFPGDDWLVALHPMVSRRAITLMLSLPVEWRREGTFAHRVIRRGWPEIMTIPINSLGFVADTMSKLSRAWKDPKAVVSKLRKMLG
ncbi:asparagine synthetase B family protein [Ovoidimarina sediminis]|uniref:hypothetical protein n=1 Tax=Ovoidimarina sediminis TaxID=3079856 RepID=UPI00290A43D8|nr:hypothetical protein [Rhodophyticola sp. MJ-SS7]MDU8943280.1 hypothetical protein [Rhodophyticola sp. MJ-SS7]